MLHSSFLLFLFKCTPPSTHAPWVVVCISTVFSGIRYGWLTERRLKAPWSNESISVDLPRPDSPENWNDLSTRSARERGREPKSLPMNTTIYKASRVTLPRTRILKSKPRFRDLRNCWSPNVSKPTRPVESTKEREGSRLSLSGRVVRVVEPYHFPLIYYNRLFPGLSTSDRGLEFAPVRGASENVRNQSHKVGLLQCGHACFPKRIKVRKRMREQKLMKCRKLVTCM